MRHGATHRSTAVASFPACASIERTDWPGWQSRPCHGEIARWPECVATVAGTESCSGSGCTRPRQHAQIHTRRRIMYIVYVCLCVSVCACARAPEGVSLMLANNDMGGGRPLSEFGGRDALWSAVCKAPVVPALRRNTTTLLPIMGMGSQFGRPLRHAARPCEPPARVPETARDPSGSARRQLASRRRGPAPRACCA